MCACVWGGLHFLGRLELDSVILSVCVCVRACVRSWARVRVYGSTRIHAHQPAASHSPTHPFTPHLKVSRISRFLTSCTHVQPVSAVVLDGCAYGGWVWGLSGSGPTHTHKHTHVRVRARAHQHPREHTPIHPFTPPTWGLLFSASVTPEASQAPALDAVGAVLAAGAALWEELVPPPPCERVSVCACLCV